MPVERKNEDMLADSPGLGIGSRETPRGPGTKPPSRGPSTPRTPKKSNTMPPWEAATTPAAVPRLTTTQDEALSKERTTREKTEGSCRAWRPGGQAHNPSHVALGGRRPSGTHTRPCGCVYRASIKMGVASVGRGAVGLAPPANTQAPRAMSRTITTAPPPKCTRLSSERRSPPLRRKTPFLVWTEDPTILRIP